MGIGPPNPDVAFDTISLGNESKPLPRIIAPTTSKDSPYICFLKLFALLSITTITIIKITINIKYQTLLNANARRKSSSAASFLFLSLYLSSGGLDNREAIVIANGSVRIRTFRKRSSIIGDGKSSSSSVNLTSCCTRGLVSVTSVSTMRCRPAPISPRRRRRAPAPLR